MAVQAFLDALTFHGVGLVAERIRNPKSPESAHSDAGCPACGIHRELAEAERLMAGVLRAWDGEPAPSERRAVILLVANNLELAREQLKRIRDARPQVVTAVEGLRRCLDEAAYSLPDRNDLNRGDWERAAEVVGRCWEMGDALAGAWFQPGVPRPTPESTEDDLERRVKNLDPETKARLLELLSEEAV